MRTLVKSTTFIIVVTLMTFMFTGCQLSLVSDIQTESRNGMTIQHNIYFDEVTDITSDTINGFKFASEGVSGHYDYGWVLCISPAVSDIDDLQEKVRQFTEANMTNRWIEERNSNADGVLTMQGHYEGISPNMQGFASLDTYADKYNTQIYAVTENGYTKVLILAVNNTDTQLVRDETALMQGTLSRTEDFKDSIDAEDASEVVNNDSSSEIISEENNSKYEVETPEDVEENTVRDDKNNEGEKVSLSDLAG